MASRIYKFTSAASTNLQPVGPGERCTLTGYEIVNTNAAARCVKVWWGNSLSFSGAKDVPTIGTDVPEVTILCAALGTTTGRTAASYTSPPCSQGTMFVATTVNPADSDATAVGSGDLIVSIFYE